MTARVGAGAINTVRRPLILPPQGYTPAQALSLDVPGDPPPALVEALAAIIRRVALEEIGAYDSPTTAS